MKISGLICEYNPLHNGHLYHLQKMREHGADAIVAIMSGNFVQRGDVAVLDKFTRAKLAVYSGVDLVIELPAAHALAPAEAFAIGGVSLLHALGNVSELSFGSECGNLDLLMQAADACRIAREEYPDVMQEFLRGGYHYPTVICNMVENMYGPETAAVLQQPNNTLAIAYLNALSALGSEMQPFTVQRKGAEHDSLHVDADASIASATFIRQQIAIGEEEQCRAMMPGFSYRMLREHDRAGRIATLKNLERVLLYKLRTTSIQELAATAEVGQGLENRIYRERTADSLENLLAAIKTKRYTMARLRRILLHLLLGIQNADMQQLPPYGRILALNDTGKQVLRESKLTRTLPFSHRLSELARTSQAAYRCAKLDAMATDIYQLACSNIGTAQQDYRRKMTISK